MSPRRTGQKAEPTRTTLCFVFNEHAQVLMILKKRGQGQGKWNGPGGKLLDGENPRDAAIRECFEETGILPLQPRELGVLEFYFPEGSENWNNICTVFRTERHTGILIPETEECSSRWIHIAKIPYDQMWDDDRRWLPLLLENRSFHRIYRFNEASHIIHEEIVT